MVQADSMNVRRTRICESRLAPPRLKKLYGNLRNPITSAVSLRVMNWLNVASNPDQLVALVAFFRKLCKTSVAALART